MIFLHGVIDLFCCTNEVHFNITSYRFTCYRESVFMASNQQSSCQPVIRNKQWQQVLCLHEIASAKIYEHPRSCPGAFALRTNKERLISLSSSLPCQKNDFLGEFKPQGYRVSLSIVIVHRLLSASGSCSTKMTTCKDGEIMSAFLM